MVERIRVAYLIDSLGMGGAERTLVTILENLDRDTFEPRVCTFQVRDGNPVADQIREVGVPVDFLPVRRLRDASAPFRLWRYLRSHRFDLVHGHLEFAYTLGGPLGRAAGCRVVATLHTMGITEEGGMASARRTLMWWSLRRTHHAVIAVSDAGRRDSVARGRLVPERVHVIHNGVDTRRFGAVDGVAAGVVRAEFGIPETSPLMVGVSVLRRDKGFHHLLAAMPSILERVPAAHVLIAGDGAEAASLQSQAEAAGLADVVHFAGRRNDIPEVMASGDLFVHPTLHDTLPTVVAEAMAAGLPVVAGRIGGVVEMVDEDTTGLLVDPGDEAALAAACIRLLAGAEEARHMGAAGRARALAGFDVGTQTRVLEDLYREVLAVPKESAGDRRS